MQGAILKRGFTMTDDPSQASVIIVNTCGFIESAAQESVDEILSLARYKQSGPCRRLIVAGCLPERYREAVAESLPEVDLFLGTGAYGRILEALEGPVSPGPCLLPPPETNPLPCARVPRNISTKGFAYLKISEGCDRHCTYCIIPKLRGRLRSRPPEDVVEEARRLAAAGYREIVVIGQDTGAYGRDLGPGVSLSGLLSELAGLSKDLWVRFLYGSPDTTDDRLIDTIAGHENLCAYFDIPMQHASTPVLKRMGRPYNREDLLAVVSRIRAAIPDAALRTTLMVGFPGETDRDFDDLMAFADTVRFDHLGAFVYSDADDLPSHRLARRVPQKTADARYHALMTAQARWSEEKNRTYLGRTLQVLVEEALEDGLCTGRTWFQAPEVDGVVYMEGAPDGQTPRVGEFATVHITDAITYDLRGEWR